MICIDTMGIVSEVIEKHQHISQSHLRIASSNISWLTPEGRHAIATLVLENPSALKNVTIRYDAQNISSSFDMTPMFNIELFNDRKKALENRGVEAKMRLRDKITQLQKEECAEIQRCTLARLYAMHPSELNAIIQQSALANDKKRQLIRFFITNGYICETYKYYMTHFVGTVLTERDTQFIRNVLEYSPLSIYYHIDNPQGVIEELRERFSQKEILNISLLQYFQSTNVCTDSTLYEVFMRCLCDAPDTFRQCTINPTVDYEELVARANTFVPTFWQTYKATEHVTKEDFLRYGLTSLYVHDTTTLDLLNEKQEFEKALLEDSNLLTYLVSNPDLY